MHLHQTHPWNTILTTSSMAKSYVLTERFTIAPVAYFSPMPGYFLLASTERLDCVHGGFHWPHWYIYVMSSG